MRGRSGDVTGAASRQRRRFNPAGGFKNRLIRRQSQRGQILYPFCPSACHSRRRGSGAASHISSTSSLSALLLSTATISRVRSGGTVSSSPLRVDQTALRPDLVGRCWFCIALISLPDIPQRTFFHLYWSPSCLLCELTPAYVQNAHARIFF